MNLRGTLVVLVLLATVLVDLVAVVALAETSPDIVRWPHPILGLFEGLPFSQVSLAGAWVGLSRRPVPWPPTIAFVAVLVWSRTLGELEPRLLGPDAVPGWVTLLALQALLVIGAIWLAQLVRPQITPQRRGPGHDRGRVQFSIRYLFGWMTALALVLGGASWLLGDAITATQLSRALRMWGYKGLILGALNALIGLTITWAVLKPDRPILRLFVSASVMVSVLPVFGVLALKESAVCLALSSATHAALLAATLGVFRIAGYRVGSGRPGEGPGAARRLADS
jgi:hypothetical protein